MKTIIAAIAVAVGGLAMAAGPAAAQNAFGSIAVGNTAYGESVAYGFAWNYGTKDDAREAALNACRTGGGADCAERTWFQNGCGALAVDRYGNGGAKAAMTQDQAEARAVQTCEAGGGSGCAVVSSQCVSPGGEAGTWSGSEHVLAAQETDADERRAEVPAEAVRTPAESLTREQRVQVQRGLAALGFDTGPADGLFGPKTRAAIWDWQEAKGLEATGYLTAEQGEALGAISKEARDQNEPTDDQTSRESAPEPSGQNVVLHFPQCSDLEELAPGDAGCWRELSNRQDCVFFLPRLLFYFQYIRKASVTWSGSCQHDTAHGKGKLEYHDMEGELTEVLTEVTESGELVEGKKQGLWISHWSGSQIREGVHYYWESIQKGHHVDGVRQGHWVESYEEKSKGYDDHYRTDEGSYVDGLKHGRWVQRIRDHPHTYYFDCHNEIIIFWCEGTE